MRKSDREFLPSLYLIGRFRTDLGLTQRDVAERMGVSPSVVARLEDPRGNPTIRSLLRYFRDGLGMEGPEAFLAFARYAETWGRDDDSEDALPAEVRRERAVGRLHEVRQAWSRLHGGAG